MKELARDRNAGNKITEKIEARGLNIISVTCLYSRRRNSNGKQLWLKRISITFGLDC